MNMHVHLHEPFTNFRSPKQMHFLCMYTLMHGYMAYLCQYIYLFDRNSQIKWNVT